MVDQLARFTAALPGALRNGWRAAPSKPNTIHRTRAHPTPAWALDHGWWPLDTYDTQEFMSFTFTDSAHVPVVVYESRRNPWVAMDRDRITFKRALELLAQPLSASRIHN